MGPCLQKPIMKVPLFTQRMVFYTSHGGYFVFHTEDIYFSHGVSRNITEISKQDYNFDYFSVAISEKKDNP